MSDWRVIVAGSRDYGNYEKFSETLKEFLSRLEGEIEIVSGGARGPDSMAINFAEEHGYPLTVFEADWKKYGKKAGFIRNAEMAEYANALIVFWDGCSKGTANMISLGQEKKLLPLTVVLYNEHSSDKMFE